MREKKKNGRNEGRKETGPRGGGAGGRCKQPETKKTKSMRKEKDARENPRPGSKGQQAKEWNANERREGNKTQRDRMGERKQKEANEKDEIGEKNRRQEWRQSETQMNGTKWKKGAEWVNQSSREKWRNTFDLQHERWKEIKPKTQTNNSNETTASTWEYQIRRNGWTLFKQEKRNGQRKYNIRKRGSNERN